MKGNSSIIPPPKKNTCFAEIEHSICNKMNREYWAGSKSWRGGGVFMLSQWDWTDRIFQLPSLEPDCVMVTQTHYLVIYSFRLQQRIEGHAWGQEPS